MPDLELSASEVADHPRSRPLSVFEAQGRTILDLLRDQAVGKLATDVLPGYLMERRWYAAKDGGVPNVGIANAISLATGDDAVILILDVTPEGQPPRKYLLPVSVLWDAEAPASAILAEVQHGSARGVLVDAFADDRFIRMLLARIGADDGASSGEIPGLIFRRSGSLDGIERELAATSDIERRAGEQSNTSVRVGGMMLKGFRRLEPGVHPELEIGRFLTEVAGFKNAPALLGSVELVGPMGEVPTALCVLQALIPNQGDGWAHVNERLKIIANEQADQIGTEQQLFSLAHCLGKRTAELHHAFAAGTADRAFAPEPFQPDHLIDWAQAICISAGFIFDTLSHARPRLDHTSQEVADRLLRRREDLLMQIAELMPAKVDVKRTRVHGDYHLGQVLISSDDVFIIDFEGEPMRPLIERRGKHLPLRDVAGMLRSFQYAVGSVTRAVRADEDTAARLQACAGRMSINFLEAYAQAVRGCPSFPTDLAQATDLLRLFVIEKALYEIGYELANRPDWADIPLAGVLAIVDGADAFGFSARSANHPDPHHDNDRDADRG
jgi:trehalose synthase-fused probable maltokinase